TGLAAILTSPYRTSLQTLQAWMVRGNYSQTRMRLPGDLDGRGLRTLRRLDLADNPLTDAAFGKLATSGCLETVEELVLSGTLMEDSGLARILAANPDRLSVLWIDNNNLLTYRCLRHLAAWPGLRKLKRLILPNASVLDREGVAALLAAPHSEDLRIILRYDADPQHEAEIKRQLQDTWPDRFEKLFVFPLS
ncbi:MAG: hypothetical protein H8E37_06305, partial [Planctomycetes bacterium]|nr:hypothetical protein [Planctomycetota bacterium]